MFGKSAENRKNELSALARGLPPDEKYRLTDQI